MKGELEHGKFEVLNHNIQKHQHDKCPTDLLLKNFHTQFKKNCLDKIETPVQQVYKDLKISFTSSLSPLEKSSFLSKMPPPKGSLMYNKLNASRIFQHMQIRSTSYKALNTVKFGQTKMHTGRRLEVNIMVYPHSHEILF